MAFINPIFIDISKINFKYILDKEREETKSKYFK